MIVLYSTDTLHLCVHTGNMYAVQTDRITNEEVHGTVLQAVR